MLSILRNVLPHPIFPLFKASFEIDAWNVSQNCFGMLLNITDVFEPLPFQCDFEFGDKPNIRWCKVRCLGRMIETGDRLVR